METKIMESKYGLVVSSRDVAEQLSKRHSDVTRDIENIIKNQSPQICGELKKMIITSQYKDEKNRQYKEYLLTKDGFTLYMFNIRGYNDFKIAYIQKFNEMEEILYGTSHRNNTINTLENDWALNLIYEKLKKADCLEKQILALKNELKVIYTDVEDLIITKRDDALSYFESFKQLGVNIEYEKIRNQVIRNVNKK